MSRAVFAKLDRVLRQIDRPGSFCVSGSAPVVLPGLEVAGLGPVGLPLTAGQARELTALCEQAPYGKGEETLVDTSVRRVWRLKPEHFALTNPEWEEFLRQTVGKVREGVGLERQNLESHLYELLLYEPGSFFLPHRDGEKLDRMVATLVLVLPSAFAGGELVVRHDGQEQVVDFGGGRDLFHTHFAAFYADCEHEVRPLRAGHRLCLVYNLTLKKGKKGLAAPRSSEYVEPVTQLLRDWARKDTARRLAVLLEHQYSQEGLTWDALKGVDRVKARVLLEAARQNGCQAHLALLTFHETASAEYAGGYYRRRRWGEEEDPADYEVGEVLDASLTADHWIDPDGGRPPLGEIAIEEDEVLDPEAIRDVDPEEVFEGYTGNEGMTLDRWYRHAAIFIWPDRKHFDVLCDAGSGSAVQALGAMVQQWQRPGQKDAAALRAACVEFAATIVARWGETPFPYRYAREERKDALLPLLAVLDEPGLIQAYLRQVVARDASVDPGAALAKVCRQHGWGTFRRELEAVFGATKEATLERNVGLLERICLAKAREQEGRAEVCEALGQEAVLALERVDQEQPAHDYWPRQVKRAGVLTGLARALLATEQCEPLSRVVDHALSLPEKYPLTEAHVAALTELGPWLGKNVKKPCPGLSRWVAACREQLEALTAERPQPPPDLSRPGDLSCKCAECRELKQFLESPHEREHRFRAREDRRQHLEGVIRGHRCDLDLRTERSTRPYTLVCTKNTATYEAQLKTFHQNQEHLATLRSIEERLPE
jgi:hypothetical protein